MTKIEQELALALMETYRAGKERGYYAQRYFAVLWQERGKPATAVRRLIADEDDIQVGLVHMCGLGLADKTAEAVALRPQFASLFTEVELGRARRRLQKAQAAASTPGGQSQTHQLHGVPVANRASDGS